MCPHHGLVLIFSFLSVFNWSWGAQPRAVLWVPASVSMGRCFKGIRWQNNGSWLCTCLCTMKALFNKTICDYHSFNFLIMYSCNMKIIHIFSAYPVYSDFLTHKTSRPVLWCFYSNEHSNVPMTGNITFK